MNIFETAVRGKYRFKHANGKLTVEQLWELNVESLNEIYMDLHRQLKKEQVESLLQTRTATDEVVEIKLEILKHIVQTKLQEAKAKEEEKANADRRKLILGIIADKENKALLDMDIEELKKMV